MTDSCLDLTFSIFSFASWLNPNESYPKKNTGKFPDLSGLVPVVSEILFRSKILKHSISQDR